MKITIPSLLLVLSASLGWAQWTIPDSTSVQQCGVGCHAPWISNDNLRLYMGTSADLWVNSRATPDSAWRGWRRLPAQINDNTPTQQCPAESPSGDTLYFIGDPRTDCESYGSWDVYYSIRTGPCDTCWGAVHNAGPDVSSSHREFSVGISRDGGTLLVASNRSGSSGADIFWHDKLEDGSWGPAHDFGPEINDLSWSDEHPSLAPDNHVLYFYRDSPVLYDIWCSHKVGGQWQTATRMPEPVNGPGMTMEKDPCIAADGRTLWFIKSWDQWYTFRVVSSTDTTVLSAAQVRPVSMRRPDCAMTAYEATGGGLQLVISGALVQGDHVVEIYDVLGRLVGTFAVRFTSDGTYSTGSVPQLSVASGTYVLFLQLSSGTLSAKFHSID